jgi:nucleotide-binding universal stress UspA family protein
MHLGVILHPTDYSPLSEATLRYALALARDYRARLVVLHVVDTLGPEQISYGEAASQPQPEAYRQRLWNEFHQRVCLPHPELDTEFVLSEEDPATAIVNTAAHFRCDLIVMGTHGRHGLQRFLGGSVTEQVIRLASCPVLVVKDVPPAEVPPEVLRGGAMHPHFLVERKG